MKTFVAKTHSKKDVQRFVKKELESILIKLNSKIDKKKFKKSIKKTAKILVRSTMNKKITNNPIEVISSPGPKK